LGIPGITAHRALFADGPIKGVTVLIAGATGGVGSVATQLAAWSGARVIGTVRNSDDVQRARQLGATHVVNTSAEDAVAQIRRIAPGGVDRIVEVAFGPNAAFNARVVSQGAVIATASTESWKWHSVRTPRSTRGLCPRARSSRRMRLRTLSLCCLIGRSR